jgi:DNA repair protein RecO (recombination protein O)
MQWTDEGFVLGARRHGETSAIVSVFSRAQGRHAGLVRGGMGRRLRPVLQVGNRVTATWRARLNDQLGSFAIELVAAEAARLLDRADRLAALAAAAAVADACLPERHPYARAYDAFAALMERLGAEVAWAPAFVRWELALLADLGFGLDLSACAVTGRNDGLAFVSPRTGRAVTAEAAAPYRDRLLALPGFLLGAGPEDDQAVRDGLRLTASFLERHALAAAGRRMPEVRIRLLGYFSAHDPTSGGITAPDPI